MISGCAVLFCKETIFIYVFFLGFQVMTVTLSTLAVSATCDGVQGWQKAEVQSGSQEKGLGRSLGNITQPLVN